MRHSIVQLLSEEFVTGIVEELSGDEGCGQDKEPEKCKAIIAELIPMALPAIASAMLLFRMSANHEKNKRSESLAC